MVERNQSGMTVSIVIPAYNERANIARLVRQVLDEPWTDGLALDELIVVDDCSNDGTTEITQQLLCEHERVRVIRHKQRSGKNAGIRTGLAVCRSDVIVFIDADVRLGEYCVTKMVHMLAESPSLAAASCVVEPLPARSWRARASRFQSLVPAEARRAGRPSLLRVYAVRMAAIRHLDLPDATHDDAYIARWLCNHGHHYAVNPQATAYTQSASGLRDFAKQTIRSWRAVAALDRVLPSTATTVRQQGPPMTLVVARAIRRELLGFLLYATWRTIIMVTPSIWWVPIVDHSKYDTSQSTKDLEP